MLEVVGGAALSARQRERAERIDEHERRVRCLDFRDDPLQDLVEIARQHAVGEIDEPDRFVDQAVVEKVILLLIAQHLQRWLAQHSEIKRGALDRRQREHHLVRKRRLAASRSAGDQVERKLR